MGLIAAVQMTSTHILQDNLNHIEEWITQAANLGATLVVLPENALLMPLNDSEKFAIAEREGQGPLQDWFKNLAKKLKLWIVAGTLPMKSDRAEKMFSTTWVYDDKGEVKARYDKMHLFDAKVRPGIEEYLESERFCPGENIVAFDSPLGKIGLSICYDLRFPELYRNLFRQDCDILLVPAAFTYITGNAHWEILLRARAIENLSFVVGAAQMGEHTSGRKTFGHSMIIDPWGKIIAENKYEEGIIMADIDLQYLKQLRHQLPVKDHLKIY